MKKIVINFILVCIAVLAVSCDEETISYADQLKDQEKLIEEFIKREGITVLKKFPLDSVFADNEYVLTESGLYFNLIEKGSGDTIRHGDEVNIRYKQKTLIENAILEEYWDTQDAPYPTTLRYNIDTECLGWTEAIGYMKRSDAHCKIIVPSMLGFSTAQNNVTPYFFELKIRFHK